MPFIFNILYVLKPLFPTAISDLVSQLLGGHSMDDFKGRGPVNPNASSGIQSQISQ
jgi:hypothetical protein